jgi:peptide/nickel transport system permease protein
VLSRVIVGARPALIVPIGVVVFAVVIGAPLGAIAGYKGGWLDEVIMRITDLFLAFPSLLLAMAIASALGRGLQNAAIALIVSWWPWYTRLVRGVTISLKERYFVEAAQAIGVRDSVIILRHILPNTISAILVQATVDLGTVILAMGGLAFLGLGTQPPSPDWGLMVSEGRTYILEQWWISTFPGMAIFIVVLAFNLLGDTLRDIFDPRQYR